MQWRSSQSGPATEGGNVSDGPRVTALSPASRGSLIEVYVDGALAAAVHKRTVNRLGLKVGAACSLESICRSMHAAEAELAMETAVRLLAMRGRARAEIEASLRRGGYGREIVAEVVGRLSRLGHIDDAQFAAQWVSERASSRPAGKQRLSRELAQKGVARPAIDAALAGVDDEREISLARKAIDRKLARLPNDMAGRRVEYQRLAGFLARRGFSWDVARRVLAEVFGREDSDAEE